jgi:hypothetical protein
MPHLPGAVANSRRGASSRIHPTCSTTPCIIIACNLTVITFEDAEAAEASDICDFKVPLSYLSDDLGELLETREGSDVSFKVKDEVFPAHKNILAVRSPVFRAEFYGPMRDEQNLRIVEDMQPTVFKGLLHFIYTDSFPAMDGLGAAEYEEMVRHLLVAAYVRHGKVEVYLREKAWPETFCADCGDHTSPC